MKDPAKAVDVVLICHVEGMNSQKHSKKKRRHLTGDRRPKMADAMIQRRQDAVILQRKEAGRLKKFRVKLPPILPTTAVLRKAKEQHTFRSKNEKYAGCIHLIGLLKFSCIYWMPEQVQIYSARCRKDRNTTLAIDATGGIVK